MRALSLREPFDPMLVALPMLSRFFDTAASFGGAFSASFGMDGGGAADAPGCVADRHRSYDDD